MNAVITMHLASSLVAPHRVVRPEQVDELADAMKRGGWRGDALVGYQNGRHIQLLSGTHRRAAAQLACIGVPVVVWPRAAVEQAWGMPEWGDIMRSGHEAVLLRTPA
jgi:ParB-like chromosome segregation protein Spo0J